MPILKQCSYHGCRKILDDGVKYCEYHQAKFEASERERYKEYQYKRRQDKDIKKRLDFYSTKEWKAIRVAVISSLYSIDILEYYRTGKLIEGERVHHIIELTEDWELRLDISNLIYLTEKNHRRVHEEYLKGHKERKAMQKILFNLLERFNNEFK